MAGLKMADSKSGEKTSSRRQRTLRYADPDLSSRFENLAKQKSHIEKTHYTNFTEAEHKESRCNPSTLKPLTVLKATKSLRKKLRGDLTKGQLQASGSD